MSGPAFPGRNPPTQLARRCQLPRPGTCRWVSLQRLGESRLHLVLRRCGYQETRALGLLYWLYGSCVDIRGGRGSGGCGVAGTTLLFQGGGGGSRRGKHKMGIPFYGDRRRSNGETHERSYDCGCIHILTYIDP